MKTGNYEYDPQQVRLDAPTEEPARQLYFIKHVRAALKAQFEEKLASGEALNQYGPKLLEKMTAQSVYGTMHIKTFGCPTV